MPTSVVILTILLQRPLYRRNEKAYQPGCGQHGKAHRLPSHIDLINTCNFAFDVPEDIADRVNIRQYMFNLRKPICFSQEDSNALKDIITGAIAAGGHDKLRAHPYMFHIEEPVSPLRMTKWRSIV